MAKKTEYLKVPGVCLVDENTLRYKDKYYDIHEIQDYLSGRFEEDTPSPVTFESFKNWINSHKEEMYDALSIVDEIKHKGEKEMDIEEKLHKLSESDLYNLVSAYREDNSYEPIYLNGSEETPEAPYGVANYSSEDKYYSYNGYGKLYSFNDLWDAVSEYELTEYLNSTDKFEELLEDVSVDDSAFIKDADGEMGEMERENVLNAIVKLTQKYKFIIPGIDKGEESVGLLNKNFTSSQLTSLLEQQLDKIKDKHEDDYDKIIESLFTDKKGNTIKTFGSKRINNIVKQYKKLNAKKSKKEAKSPRQEEKKPLEEKKPEKVEESPRQEEKKPLEEKKPSNKGEDGNETYTPRKKNIVGTELQKAIIKNYNLSEKSKNQIIEFLIKKYGEGRPNLKDELLKMDIDEFKTAFLTPSDKTKSGVAPRYNDKYIEEHFPLDKKDEKEKKEEEKESDINSDEKKTDENNSTESESEEEEYEGSSDSGENALDEDEEETEEREAKERKEKRDKEKKEEDEENDKENGYSENLSSGQDDDSDEDYSDDETSYEFDKVNSDSDEEKSSKKEKSSKSEKSPEYYAQEEDERVNKHAKKNDKQYVSEAKRILSSNFKINISTVSGMRQMLLDKYGDFGIANSDLFRAFTHVKYLDDVTKEYPEVQDDYRDMVREYKNSVLDECISRYFEAFERLSSDSKTKFKNLAKAKFLRNEFDLDELIDFCKHYENKYGDTSEDFTVNDLKKYIRRNTHNPNWQTSEKGYLYEMIIKEFKNENINEAKAKELVGYTYRKDDLDEIKTHIQEEVDSVGLPGSPEDTAQSAIEQLCDIAKVDYSSPSTAWNELEDKLENTYKFNTSYINSVKSFIEKLSNGTKSMGAFENAKKQFKSKCEYALEYIEKRKKLFGTNKNKHSTLYNLIAKTFNGFELTLTVETVAKIENLINNELGDKSPSDDEVGTQFAKPLRTLVSLLEQNIGSDEIKEKVLDVFNNNKSNVLEYLAKILTQGFNLDGYKAFVNKIIELVSSNGETKPDGEQTTALSTQRTVNFKTDSAILLDVLDSSDKKFRDEIKSQIEKFVSKNPKLKMDSKTITIRVGDLRYTVKRQDLDEILIYCE